MPTTEQSERIAGAAFLGVPAFEAFVWLLDNYARFELLVRLHDRLPPLLTSPITNFVSMCVGLGLMYLSYKAQLKRLFDTANARSLVDASGAEILRKEKPGWLLVVAVVFLIAFITAPVLAVLYSLAYQGTVPPSRAHKPEAIAYFKTPIPSKSPKRPPSIQSAPGGINIGGNNLGNATVNNYGPPSRRIPEDMRPSVIQMLSKNPGDIQLFSVDGDSEGLRFLLDWEDVLRTANWRIQSVGKMFATTPWYGIAVQMDGDPLPSGTPLNVSKDSPAGCLLMTLQQLRIEGVQLSLGRKIGRAPVGTLVLNIGLRPGSNK